MKRIALLGLCLAVMATAADLRYDTRDFYSDGWLGLEVRGMEPGLLYYLERQLPPSTNWIVIDYKHAGPTRDSALTNWMFYTYPTNRIEFYRVRAITD